MFENKLILALSIIILCVSTIMIGINECCYHFKGLFYFVPEFFSLSLLLWIVHAGLKLQFNWSNDQRLLKMIRSTTLYFALIVVVFIGTSAIQYTPFSPIDNKILAIEHFFHLDLKATMEWFGSKNQMKWIADHLYHTIGLQLLIIPLCIIVLCRRYELLYEFYCLILITWLFGSLFYYFFPTTGPASVIESTLFDESQRATGLKFWQLHHYILPETADGGMIAMPSFHVIWAWLLVYIVRPWPIAFGLLGVINVLVVSSCVLLGWHYFLDVLGSAMIIGMSHFLFYVWHVVDKRQRAV